MPDIHNLFMGFLLSSSMYSSIFAQPFVGQISYSTRLDFHSDDKEMQDYFLAKYGDSLLVSIDSKGQVRRDYKGTGAHGFDFSILDPESHTSYHKFHYANILFAADAAAENTWIANIDTLARVEIEGRICDVFRIRVLEPVDEDVLPWTYTFWLDRSLPLQPERYKDCREGHWNAISALNGGMYLKMELRGALWTLTYTFVSVEVKQVDEVLFETDYFNVLWID